MSTKVEATIDDLMRVEGKAELVNGEIVPMPPTGGLPGFAGGKIYRSLDDYRMRAGRGYALPDNVAYKVNLPHREAFSPDASYYTGQLTMSYLVGPPVFAAEVRSENDYGKTAEAAMAEKRRDYFATGTLVVWDVDLLGADVVRAYHAADPDVPQVFRRGEVADAEPSVPGWRMPVDDLFE
ncbi:MAG: Uma2 family endonuclease [Acidobacteriota bacterium]|nr:Uma2 family endonuclease [Acidobacteriota bacterium]